ncbi:MAG: MBL fold metallo-hydrolase [Candidatus Sungbacteria bacterium]|uniref:MBL fold metallo-hydrolase n=1 Tax=Candidatus Sungiibacteriota bacterium TaxID=2750080 RepID=A0A932YVZ2_9BACT|nr:MBL fold metallo-hydrolase [Candidatus Sungbacteria bacterium]
MPSLRRFGYWYLLGALALAAVFIWSAVFWIEAHRGRLYLHVLDVGQGDALLIEAPNGSQVLIDGGPDTSVLARLGEIMPFWDRSLDLIVLTHPHADHLDGLLTVLQHYTVGAVIESGVNHTIPEYAVWESEIKRRGIGRIAARRGQVVGLSGGASLSLLAPFRPFDGVSVRNVHEASVVMRLEFAGSTALLMADAEAPLERELLAAGGGLRADVLKVGHHGSKTSTSQAFLDRVQPRLAAISAGRQNRYGHPAQEVLDRLHAAGIAVFRTDGQGTVTFVSGGRGFAVRAR